MYEDYHKPSLTESVVRWTMGNLHRSLLVAIIADGICFLAWWGVLTLLGVI